MLVITATIAALRYTTRISSTKKQFRERAVGELREIGEQVQGLTTDRKLYPSFETEVITANPGLAHSSNPYLALIRGCYTKATTMRLRRLLAPDADLSLRRLIRRFLNTKNYCTISSLGKS